jgi:hypothetical protein
MTFNKAYMDSARRQFVIHPIPSRREKAAIVYPSC